MGIERSSKGLANYMFEELDMLRAGENTPQQVSASSRAAAVICAISRLEMDHSRFVSSARTEKPMALDALPMGQSKITSV